MHALPKPVRVLLIGAGLYAFFVSIGLMSLGFKSFGRELADALIAGTSNPAIGLLIGILATSLVQSSSLTTSIVVGFVGSGTLLLENAIPMVMGANLGTTVTSTIVSLGHVSRRKEFRRAMEAATVHDFFNILTVVILFPLEVATGFIRTSSIALAGVFEGVGGGTFSSPVKLLTKPVVKSAKALLTDSFGLENQGAGVVMVLSAFVLLFLAMWSMVTLLKSLVLARMTVFFDRFVGGSLLLSLSVGLGFTVLVQSSSITTSILVPMAGAGILTVEKVFPIVLGCNIGTTLTALMAAMAVESGGTGPNLAVAIALAHLIFNLAGVVLVCAIPPLGRLPLQAARTLAYHCAYGNRLYAVWFILFTFFLVPGGLILLFD